MSQFELKQIYVGEDNKYNTSFTSVYELRGLDRYDFSILTVEQLFDLGAELNKEIRNLKDERKEKLNQQIACTKQQLKHLLQDLEQLEQL